jgi:PAS domain S-box-containing protein
MALGWFAGMKWGLVIGFICGLFFDSAMLAYLYREWELDVLLRHQGIPGAALVTLLGGGAGYFRELRDRYVREINGRIAAQRELEFSRRRIEQILRTIPSAVFSTDAQQRITSWNRTAEIITGLAESQVKGRKCTDIWDCPACREHCGLLDPVIQKPVFGREMEITLPGGKVISIVKNVDALYDEQGVFAGGVESFVDITALKRIHRELERKNREIVDLTNTISHDLRNPLTGIRGILELHSSEAEERNDEKNLTLYRLALKEVDYMQGLLDDLLETARLDVGSRSLDLKTVPLRQILDKVVELFSPQIRQYHIAVSLPAEPVSICADERGIEKVCMNLVGNAITYMGAQPRPSIAISTRSDNGRVTLRITDNGMGIPSATLPLIFEKFRRGSNVGSIKGTGLGLSIVKSIVEAHGGTVGVSSVEGEGSTFTITLPRGEERCREKEIVLAATQQTD